MLTAQVLVFIAGAICGAGLWSVIVEQREQRQRRRQLRELREACAKVRRKYGPHGPSIHAQGLAFDFDPGERLPVQTVVKTAPLYCYKLARLCPFDTDSQDCLRCTEVRS